MKFSQAYHFLIFFSLTITSPAIAKYAKTGCNDTCGNNVRIPFPFGIGADCSVNQWYIVDCKSSTPYLSTLNHLEVLGVNLEDQTVIVSTSRTNVCKNPVQNSIQTRSIDLGGSPFLFSKLHNKFVFEGCGIAVMMDDGSVVTGCSTACLNVTVSNKNNCSGIGCCQAAIPHYLKSYNITMTDLDGGCGSAFLVDETSYHPFFSKDSSLIPISLLWTLTDSDPVTCIYHSDLNKRLVDMFKGTPVETLQCTYSDRSLHVNVYLEDGNKDDHVKEPRYAKTGCNDMCGNVRIPYPFGIGASCSLNHWYIVDCNSSTPYLPSVNNLELLGVSLENQTVMVSTPLNCQKHVGNSSQTMSIDLGGSPFFFSKPDSKFVFEGCGIAVMMDNGRVITACSAACGGGTLSDRNNCFGIGCCQTTIPNYLKSYSINLTNSKEEDGGCGSAFLVDKASYDQRGFSDPSIPISLRWTLADTDGACCYEARQGRVILDVFNGTQVDTWTCYGESGLFEGNPYIIDGCDYRADKSTDNTDTEECKRCRDNGGHCTSNRTFHPDTSISNSFLCLPGRSPQNGTPLSVILGVGITVGVLFLVGVSYVLYKWIKNTKEKRQRKRFFKRNGGLLLKQQEEADSSLVDKTTHFTSDELQKATDNFNENRILGRGGQGTVYKGMLMDGRIVAVKKSKIVNECQLKQFINEVVILSQINHRNVVKLLGCCLETEVPLLVSEFIPNGTLYDLLHNETNELPISLNMRLQIATEVAGALAYLHSTTSIPIYHRDVKTTNILLDEKYRAKVSDFGTSRFVSVEQTHLTTLVKGTFGYFDPEYFRSSKFTEKSDVYSFGVVLVELLTGEKPISQTSFGESRSLAMYFMLAMDEGRVMSIFDALVIKEGTRDELLTIANLAMRCLNHNGKYRPTMIEVATELEIIRRSHIPTNVQTNINHVV